ncbi:MAG: anti-sigma factor RsiW, partial [Myxococcota bacterium]
MSDPQDIREHKLTAYALGELDRDGRAEVETWLAEDASARETLEEINATVALIEFDIAAEPGVGLTESQAVRIAAGPKARSNAGRGWLLGVAAIAAVGLAFALWPSTSNDLDP